jgi:serine/threonine protein kinase
MKYMAPEQARGHEVDKRADVFSFGVLLYEMLSGHAPFGGTLDALIKRVKDPPPELPSEIDISASVRKIVARCIETRREARYPAMEPLIVDLNEAIAELKALESSSHSRDVAHALASSDQSSSEVALSPAKPGSPGRVRVRENAPGETVVGEPIQSIDVSLNTADIGKTPPSEIEA